MSKEWNLFKNFMGISHYAVIPGGSVLNGKGIA